MTIEFNCPQCGALIAFADQHAGKGAKCVTCGQHLIIPKESFAKSRSLAEDQPDWGEPLPGFYSAAFAYGWRLFLRAENVVPLAFVAVLVCFKYFIAHVDYSFTLMGKFAVYLPLGLCVRGICWGCLFWYYLEIINNTVLSENHHALPEVEIEGYSDFFANALRSIWVVGMAMILCGLPAALAGRFSAEGSSGLASQIVVNFGLFMLPMLILAVGVTRDSTMLVRLDLTLPPLFKTFLAYLSVALLIMAMGQLQIRAKNYGDSGVIDAGRLVKAGWLAYQLALQIPAIIAARALGLLYRHYECYFRW